MDSDAPAEHSAPPAEAPGAGFVGWIINAGLMPFSPPRGYIP